MKNITMDRFRIWWLKTTLNKINALSETMTRLSDAELQAKTPEFKKRIEQGSRLEEILPEAYAAMREANKRILGQYPYDVQILGALVLHQGQVAEMKTGEGKTLTATLPLYLNALSGQGVLLVTTNDYLARRDAEEMGPVFEFMGLSVTTNAIEDPKTGKLKDLKPEQKREIYQHDIVYTTNSILGFDYLAENLMDSEKNLYLRPFHYAIIDEIDEVLLDTAQMPLIISGSPRVQSNLFSVANDFVVTLEKDAYTYIESEHKIWLNDSGIEQAQRFFRVDNLFAPENRSLNRHLNLALRANYQYERDKQYVVQNGEIYLLDATNGRIMKGMKLQGGQHQALEAKEHVKLTPETRAMASITYQNLFRMFQKLAGMTGTGKPSEEEFISTYNMSVISIPTHKPVIRQDLPDEIYTTLPQKLYASLKFLKKCHQKGQPVLVFASSVEMSEIYSEMLLEEGISHNVLNARNSAKEALIIKEAGQFGAVTVATTLAGRGTDIKLGPGVAELGGLAVICTERMMNKRQDLQAKGRSGRQGDPGLSRTFVSLEDELLVQYGTDDIRDYYKKHRDNPLLDVKPLSGRKFQRAVNQAQVLCEDRAKEERRSTLELDDVVTLQRNIVYGEREKLLSQAEEASYDILEIAADVIDHFLTSSSQVTETQLRRFILDSITYRFTHFEPQFPFHQADAVRQLLLSLVEEELARKVAWFTSEDKLNDFYKVCILKAIDEAWVENVDNLQQLKLVISGRQYSQRNLQLEYQREAKISYERMQVSIKEEILKNILLSELKRTIKGKTIINFA